MALRQRYIEYFAYNINTYSDIITLKEELKKLLDNQFIVSLQISAHGHNNSEFGVLSQNSQVEDIKPTSSLFNTPFSPLDYSSPAANGSDQKHSI